MIRLLNVTILSVLLATSCATPDGVRQGANLSAVELSNFQAQLKSYAKRSNIDTAARLERLSRELDEDLALQARTENRLYVGLADEKSRKALHTELTDRVAVLNSRDTRAVELKQAYDARLVELTTNLSIADAPFKNTQEALAKLADSKAQKVQLSFIIAYIQKVAAEYEVEQKALEKAAEEASNSN